ncbi:MAG: hypothetical protein ACKOXB_14320 [Flavobacteriales bacterium]
MKTLVFLFISAGAYAQSGVYMTYDDYVNNKLSYANQCDGKNKEIKTNLVFNLPYVTVASTDGKVKLDKDNIYAVSSCDQSLIRFENNQAYYLQEKGAVWIFYKEVSVNEGKRSVIQKRYYFSTTGDSELKELTIKNVKDAFPENHKLHELLDSHQQCYVSDEVVNVNHLLKKSVQ